MPLFNKGVKKFTRIFKAVFEKAIEKELNLDDVDKLKLNQVGGIRKGLQDELNENNEKINKK